MDKLFLCRGSFKRSSSKVQQRPQPQPQLSNPLTPPVSDMNKPETCLIPLQKLCVYDFEIRDVSNGIVGLESLTRQVKLAESSSELNVLRDEMRLRMDDVDNSARIVKSWLQNNYNVDYSVRNKIVKVMELLERLRKDIVDVEVENLEERGGDLEVKEIMKEMVSEVEERLIEVQEIFVECKDWEEKGVLIKLVENN